MLLAGLVGSAQLLPQLLVGLREGPRGRLGLLLVLLRQVPATHGLVDLRGQRLPLGPRVTQARPGEGRARLVNSVRERGDIELILVPLTRQGVDFGCPLSVLLQHPLDMLDQLHLRLVLHEDDLLAVVPDELISHILLLIEGLAFLLQPLVLGGQRILLLLQLLVAVGVALIRPLHQRGVQWLAPGDVRVAEHMLNIGQLRGLLLEPVALLDDRRMLGLELRAGRVVRRPLGLLRLREGTLQREGDGLGAGDRQLALAALQGLQPLPLVHADGLVGSPDFFAHC